jgi:hypothetical protein
MVERVLAVQANFMVAALFHAPFMEDLPLLVVLEPFA